MESYCNEITNNVNDIMKLCEANNFDNDFVNDVKKIKSFVSLAKKYNFLKYFKDMCDIHMNKKTLFFYVSSCCIEIGFDNLIVYVDTLCVHIIDLICAETNETNLWILYNIFIIFTKLKTIYTKKTILNVSFTDIIKTFEKIKRNTQLKIPIKNDFDIFKNLLNILNNYDDKKTFLQMTYITYHDRAISYSMNLIMWYIAKEIDKIDDNVQLLDFYWSNIF